MSKTLKDRLRSWSMARSAAGIQREAAAMNIDARDALLQKVQAKTLVFAVASGRSGTQTLAKVFELVPGVHATHEGIPAFQDVMRRSLGDPELAKAFLLTRKLPAIAALEEPVYFESSHVFGKGFLMPMLQLGLRPRLLFLKRDPRKIALSLERIGATPHRTPGGRDHFLSPADPSMLPAIAWGDFTDYQLCYWYALETIRRQRVLFDTAVRKGCNCRYLRIEDLASPTDVWTLMAAIGAPLTRNAAADAALGSRVGQAFNLKEKSPSLDRPLAELEAQEQMVIDRVQACLPELNLRRMLAAYLSEPQAGVLDAEPLSPVESATPLSSLVRA